MNFLYWIFGKLTDQVRFKDTVAIRVLGQVYPLVMTSTSGSSDGYKTTYVIRRGSELIDIEPMDVEEFISGWYWVPKNSLEGILTHVRYDDKLLK